MLERLNRNIKVIVNQGDRPVYIVHYHCAKCNSIHECPNPINCHFVNYIRERIMHTTYKMNPKCNINSDMPLLTVFVADDAARARALNVIRRAQRLRSNRAILQQKTL